MGSPTPTPPCVLGSAVGCPLPPMVICQVFLPPFYAIMSFLEDIVVFALVLNIKENDHACSVKWDLI